jgi:FAD:protein FMN transferase
VRTTALGARPRTATISRATFSVWGTRATVAMTRDGHLGEALVVLDEELRAFDRACNRFRLDSEVSVLNRWGSSGTPPSRTFLEALAAACRAAELTDGLVDPTIGGHISALGYDRDIDAVQADGAGPAPRSLGRVPGWRCLSFDPTATGFELPEGVELDFGATAKALCVDRAVATIWERTGGAVAVEIGGDLAVAGPPPPGGWHVSVRRDARRPGGPESVVTICDGAVASSGTSSRVWSRGETRLHHIIDPRTGRPAEAIWELVTVAARTCVDANTAATAAVLWGNEAPFRLGQLGLPARLARVGGEVVTVADWPAERRSE